MKLFTISKSKLKFIIYVYENARCNYIYLPTNVYKNSNNCNKNNTVLNFNMVYFVDYQRCQSLLIITYNYDW